MCEWPRVPISDIARVVLGGTPNRNNPDYWNGNILWATAKDVTSALGRYINKTEERITRLGLEKSAAKLLPKGTVVITARGTVGAVAQLGTEMAFNQTCYGLVAKPGIDQDYLFYAVKGTLSETQSLAYGTVFDTITMASFDHWKVPVPPLHEQRAIAHILGTLDDKIELNQHMNDTLEAIARAIFKSWFVDFDPVIDNALKAGKPFPDELEEKAARRREVLTRVQAEGRPAGLPDHLARLFPDEFEESELGWIPKGWRAVSLPEAVEVNPLRKLHKGEIAPYLDMANMPTRSARALRFCYRKYTSGTRFISGDVLLARITPCLENGKVCYVDFVEKDKVGWGSTEYIVLRSKPPLPLEYVYFLIRTEEFRTFAIANMTGTSGRQRLSAESLKYYLVVVPTVEIAKIFGEFASLIFAKLKANDEESLTLAALRDALLPKLISGNIRVKDAEKFLEEQQL